jgi:hypothetical protein
VRSKALVVGLLCRSIPILGRVDGNVNCHSPAVTRSPQGETADPLILSLYDWDNDGRWGGRDDLCRLVS